MISRSDGKLFHVLLADRPVPYPAERQAPASAKVSVCFWYSHVRDKQATRSTVVILSRATKGNLSLFRQIEEVADSLAELLTESRRVAVLYEWIDGALAEMAY